MGLQPFMARLLAGRVEREHRAMQLTDEAAAKAALQYDHRDEPLVTKKQGHSRNGNGSAPAP